MRKLKLQVQMTIDGFMAGPNGGMDWLYAAYLQVSQHKDIIEANTPWLKPEVYWNDEWKTGGKRGGRPEGRDRRAVRQLFEEM